MSEQSPASGPITDGPDAVMLGDVTDAVLTEVAATPLL